MPQGTHLTDAPGIFLQEGSTTGESHVGSVIAGIEQRVVTGLPCPVDPRRDQWRPFAPVILAAFLALYAAAIGLILDLAHRAHLVALDALILICGITVLIGWDLTRTPKLEIWNHWLDR